MSIYPDEGTITIDGEELSYPGLKDGKFYDGDPEDPTKKPSFIPAASINLILDNLADFITRSGKTPNNSGTQQLWDALWSSIKPGVVWMYDGTDWVDNVTLPGFYACIPENENGGTNGLTFGIQSMVDRFVMGKAIEAAGATGGANSFSLTVGQLPSHDHSINHDHASVTSGTQSDDHTHYVSGTTASDSHYHFGFRNAATDSDLSSSNYPYYSSDDNNSYYDFRITGGGSGPNIGRTSSDTHSHTWSDTSGIQSTDHAHTVNLPEYSGNSGATGNGDAIDNRPSFYSMIYIRKCA